MFPAYSTLGSFPVSTLTFLAVIESDNPLNPYVQSWTAGVQRELAHNTTLDVNYIGTHAIHLLDRRQIAQPNAIPSDSLAFCQTQVNGKYVNLGVAPCSNASRRPYPNFSNIFINSDWHGYSHYNGLNVKFEHRARDLAADRRSTPGPTARTTSRRLPALAQPALVSRDSWTITTRNWTTVLPTSTSTRDS